MAGHDLRYALRAVRAEKLFSVAAILTMALGIGANTAIFAIVDGVLLRPLPYKDPDRVVVLWSHWTGWTKTWLSEPELADYQQQARSLASVGGYAFDELNLTGAGESIRVRAVRAQAAVFSALGIAPVAGRAFTSAEDQPGAARVALVSERLWRAQFAADPAIVGRNIQLDGVQYDVVGVVGGAVRLPNDYGSRQPADVWLPLALHPPDPADRDNHGLFAVASLATGATLAGAQAEMNGITRRLIEQWPALYDRDFGVSLVPAAREVFGPVRAALLLLWCAVGAVLLIACANVTHLLLARTDARAKEFAIRAALGAGRLRIARQLFTEALLLSAAGAAAGCALAAALVRAFVVLDPARLPRATEVAIDGRVIAATAAATLGCTFLVGLLPVWRAGRQLLRPALGATGRTDRAGGGRVRHALIVGQIAASVTLVAVALTLTASFLELVAIDPGFESSHVLTLRTSFPRTTYADGRSVALACLEVRRHLLEAPGVVAVGAAAGLPLASVRGDTALRIGRAPNVRGSADWQVVTPGYFEALGARLRSGRFFTDADRDEALPVALINETLARTYFGDRTPVGERIAVGLDRGWSTVVGVIADIHHRRLDAPARAEVYRPHAQFRFGGADGAAVSAMTWVIRTAGDPLGVAASARAAIRAVDPGLGASDVASMDDVVKDATSDRRLDTWLSVLFGVLAMFLTSVGVYGVVAYAVAQRTHEIGVRLAVGAAPADVWSLVVSRVASLTGAGIAVGAIGAVAAGAFIRAVLFDSRTTTPLLIGGAAIVVAAVSLAAAALAGRRAMRVSPARVLSG